MVPTLSSKTGLTSQPCTLSKPSTIPREQSPPDSNSRGDYVTTRYTTQHPTYTLPLGFTETEAYGPSGVVLVGPTTWATQDVLPVIEVANDLNKTSSAPQPWDPSPFLSLVDQTILTGDPSFISYGREPECTSAFSSYAATNPSTIYTEKFVATITLSNGQTSRAVAYCFSTALLRNLFSLFQRPPNAILACFSSQHSLSRKVLGRSQQYEYKWDCCSSRPVYVCNGLRRLRIVSYSNNDVATYSRDTDDTYSTSPSIYVRFPTVSASDACGFIGSTSTSITLAFSPGELSTFVWELYRGTSSQTYTSALDTADLPCGPWNGTNKFLPEPWSNYSSYQPLIVLPSKLINMVPAWKSCTADIFEGQDPPRALTPAAVMAPTPTDTGRDAQNNAPSPSPSIPSLPRKTESVSPQPADPSPKTNSAPKADDPPTGASGDPEQSIAPSNPSDPSTKDPGDSSKDDASSKPNDPSSAGSEGSSNHNPHPKPNDPSTDDPGDSSGDDPPSKPKEPSSVGSGGSSSDDSQSSPNDPSTGFSGDPNDPNEPADKAVSPAPSPASNPTRTPAGDPPAQGPSNSSPADKDTKNTPPGFPPAVALQGDTITQGADPKTISQMPVVYQSGSISVGGEVKAIPTGWGQSSDDAKSMVVGGLTFSAIPSATEANGDPYSSNDHAANPAQMNDPAAKNSDPATYITVAGQTIAVDANAISVAGTTLKPGDPGVTVDGTPISLGSSIFVVGTRTETLSSPQAAITAQSPLITVGSQTLSLDSNAVVVDGTTLKLADPAITVDGTRVSLGPSFLVVGSHTQSLVLPQTASTAAPSYITVAGETIAVGTNSIIVAGHTMTPGGPPVTADGTLISLGPSILVVGTQTVSFTLPTALSSEGIGAVIMKGLGGIGGATVAKPTQTGGRYNGTRVGNTTVVFRGGARKEGGWWFRRWVIWVWM